MRVDRRWIVPCWVLLAFVSGWCHAQSTGSVTPEDEYKKLIKVNQDIQPLGAHPFGENISLYDGTLSFEVTDVSVSGNGPLLQLGRSLKTAEGPGYAFDAKRPLGDWDLEIPRIEALTANQTGWVTSPSGALNRCSYFRAPPDVLPSQPGGDPWTASQWWYGDHLIVPGYGNQSLLSAPNRPTVPTISGMSFPISTKGNWMLSCGVTASDGGEGFLAIAPDGTRYTFAHLVYRPMTDVTSPLGTAPMALSAEGGVHPMVAPFNFLKRQDALLYVTQVQDRFGNTLTYNWSGNNLSSIVASDGRKLTLTYVAGTPRIHAVTVQSTNAPARTWTYGYDTSNTALPTLTSVQLPDGGAWSYQLNAFQTTKLFTEGGNCQFDHLPTMSAAAASGSITHPSGLKATFTLTPMLHGRSYVPKSCYGAASLGAIAYFSTYPEYYYQFSLTNETVSGAGLPTEHWTYSYSPANLSWSSDACASTNSCPSTVYTDVTDPGGHGVRYTFSNRFDASEGQLKRTDYYSGGVGSTLVRSEANIYADPTSGPWPASFGDDLQRRDNSKQTEQLAPLQKRTITQDGNTYTWQAESFNAYAQVTKTNRYNNVTQQSLEEATTYLNDTSHWVLGLPLTVTNVGKGEVESSNTYNSLDELTARARFGRTLMHYAWNSAGQLASFTDGDSHTTTLGNYYRGIPRAIGYPDGTSESLAVDDLGQITAITDQAGHATRYNYDAIGRIAKVTYPYDSGIDSASWYPKTFSYSYVTGAERGLAAGHWRRTTTQGTATDTTYFDAELRPVLDDTSNGSAHISTAIGYDWRGLTTFASYPASGSPALSAITTGTHSTYDALGRLTKTLQDSELGTLTTTTAYLSGARKQVTDPKGNVATTTYQVLDQPAYNAVTKVQAPAGITQTITRDVYGNPLSIIQSGSYGTESDSVTKTLVYDSYKRLCRTTEPETGSTVMAYDGANNLAWSADGLAITGSGCGQDQVAAAARTNRTYDAMNRVLTIQPPSGTQATKYTYDALGHMKTAISGMATQTHNYNSLGLPTLDGLRLPGDGYAWSVVYGYDAYGHLSTVGYPAGTGASETVSYAPDAWGRPTRAGNYATGAFYFPDGQLKGFTFASGTSYLTDQNARQLTSNFTYGAGSTLAISQDLAYDKNGNLTTVNDLVDHTRDKTFGYDALNRLTSDLAPNLYGADSYAYDALNNLRQEVTGGMTFNLNPDAYNRLTSMTAGSSSVATYLNDDAGNRTSMTFQGTTTNYAWDARHQLTSVSRGGTNLVGYAYDANGRRIKKIPADGSPPIYYFYNHAGQLMYQYDPATATATDYIYLGTKLVGDSTTTQLAQPGGVSFSTNPNNGSTGVSWGAVPQATSYTLEQSGNGGSNWSTVYSGSGTSTTVSNLAGGDYLYRVQACASGNCGNWTTSPTLGVTPAIPTITTPAGTMNGTYTVSWNATAGASGYTVQEQVNSGAWSTLASNTTATSVSRPGTTSGRYAYRVEALNSHGNRGWGLSATVTVNTVYGVVPTPVPSLSVPAISHTGSATVSWNASSPVTGYTLQQSSNGGTSWSTVYSGTGTSTARTSLGNGSYTYRVQACNTAGGGSACTAWASGGPLVVTHPPASAPSLSVPATSSTGSYTVSWGGVSTATSYTLQESVNGGSWATAYSGSAKSKALSGKGNGTYTYRVEACNAGGCSAWSGSKSTVVTHPPTSAPSLSVPATSSTGGYTVSWGSVSTATSYTLQESVNGGSWTTAYSGSAQSKAISGKGNGTYAYRVEACNAGGCSAWSGSKSTVVTHPPASAPSLSVPATSSTGSYTVSWGSVSTATSYTLQESSNGGSSWSTAYTGSGTSKALSGRGDGTYTYRVEACNAGGCGPWSATHAIAVALIPVMPAHPLTLTVTGPTAKPVIHVTWTAVAEATSYTLQMEEPAAGTGWTTVNGVSGTTWSQLFLYSGAVDFRLQACNSHGCSAWSSAQGVTVQGGGGLLAEPEANPAEAGSTANPAAAASTGAQP